MVANSILEIGCCYKHLEAGNVMEVRGVSDIGCTITYDCFVFNEYKMMQLSFGTEADCEEFLFHLKDFFHLNNP